MVVVHVRAAATGPDRTREPVQEGVSRPTAVAVLIVFFTVCLSRPHRS